MKRTNKQSKNAHKKEEAILACLLSFFLLMLTTLVFAMPTGPSSIVISSNETKATTNGMMVNISGGYIAKMNISASVQNPHWKALVGEISGSFTLDDASGSRIYNWSAGSANGEIYATRQSGSITWASITCADSGEITAEEGELTNAGTDDITATFGSTNTGTYVVASNPVITPGACSSTNTYVNNVTQSTFFEEIILHDGTNIIYASVIETDETGYDGGAYDFQMLIPENGTSGSAQIPYYIYVELD